MFTELNSPLQQIARIDHPDLWMKRDDQIDPYISGNKWRKLKYIIEAAYAMGKTHLVTFGGPYSNHLVATASAAARSGFRSTAFVRGEPVYNEMMVICRLYGMQIIYTDREDYKDQMGCYELLFGPNDKTTYVIPEGGAAKDALPGCAEIIDELPLDTAHIFVAAGTGTTAAGLLQGINASGRNIQLHVIPVLKGGDYMEELIAHYEPNTKYLQMHNDYHFGGYAKVTPMLTAFMRDFVNKTGVLLDPIYTAKMCFGMMDLIATNVIPRSEKVVAIHTGGLLGIMGMRNRFF